MALNFQTEAMKTKSAIYTALLAGLLLPLLFSCKKEEAIKVVPTLNVNMYNITSTSAKSESYVTNVGGSTMIEQGILWNISQNPSTPDHKIIDVIGLGSDYFTFLITRLKPGTTYNVKAYAMNSVGTGLSSQTTFTTLALVPVITTSAITDITTISAKSGGNITSDGGSTITERGIVWSLNLPVLISDNKVKNETGSSLGSYACSISNLLPGTTYYFRAYALNSVGAGVGDVVSFNTEYIAIKFNPNLTYGTVSDIEGNIYKTITIGTQTWMAENLKTTKYRNGNSISNVTDNEVWGNLTTPGYCWYDNDVSKKKNYGALYNWYAINSGILCPIGWHIPTDAEWTTLERYLGGYVDVKLKAIDQWWGGTNTSGFTAIPGGYRIDESNAFFNYLGTNGYWWSSTEDNYGVNGYVLLDQVLSGGKNGHSSNHKNAGLSIRCIKD